LYQEHGPAENIYTEVIVTGRDRILPSRNQIRAWNRDRCRVLRADHFPFYAWQGLLPPEHKQGHDD
jgi:hypothetical protein